MKSVLLKGPILTSTGYGSHVRQIFHSIKDEKINLFVEETMWGDDKYSYLVEKENHKEILDYTKKARPEKYDLSIQVMLPNEWQDNLAVKNVGVTAGIESTYCKEEWLAFVNKMDRVIVPSIHAKNSFINSFKIHNLDCNTDIEVISLYADISFYDSKKEETTFREYEKLKTDENYLIVGKMTSHDISCDRKSIVSTLNDINEYYSRKNKTCTVIVKTSFGLNSFDEVNKTTSAIKDYVFQKEKNIDIVFVTGTMCENEIYSLYNNNFIKAFILLTKGECFCIPALEAMILNVPVVMTNWSAHTEFLKSYSGFYPVEYYLEKCNLKNIFMPKDSEWAIYNKKSFFSQLDRVSPVEKVNIYDKTQIIEKYRKVIGELCYTL